MPVPPCEGVDGADDVTVLGMLCSNPQRNLLLVGICTRCQYNIHVVSERQCSVKVKGHDAARSPIACVLPGMCHQCVWHPYTRT